MKGNSAGSRAASYGGKKAPMPMPKPGKGGGKKGCK